MQLTVQPRPPAGQPTGDGGPAPKQGWTSRWPRGPLGLVLVIAAIWALGTGAYLTGLGVLLPVAVLVATASLLRGGQTLLDRLVLAFALLFGATCAVGLLLSVWPPRLHPVFVAGVALTVLALFAARTGRRPSLPRPGLSDLITGGVSALVTAYVAYPLLRADPVQRLGVVMSGEDFARHINLFDAIRQTGGYLFLHRGEALEHVFNGTVFYPQGSHFLAALLDNFVRSSATATGTGVSASDHYMAYVVAGFGMLILTVAWAAQWLAGAALSPARRVVLVGFVVAFAATGDLMFLIPAGYPSEVVGLMLMLLLTALLARPVQHTRQQLAIVGSLLVAVGFTYYLFLPAAGLATLIWLWQRRARVLRHRPTLAVIAVLVAVLSPLPLALGLALGNQTVSVFESGGLHPSRDLLVALGGAVVAGLFAHRARRSRIWRRYCWAVVPAVLLAIGFLAVQRAMKTPNGYFPNKTLHLVQAELLVGVGVLLHYLPKPDTTRLRLTRAGLARLVPAAIALVAIAGAFSMVRGDSPYRPRAPFGTAIQYNWAQYWFHRMKRDDAGAADVTAILRRWPQDPAGAARITLILTDDPVASYTRTLFLSVLDRTAGKIAPGLYLRTDIRDPERPGMIIDQVPGPIRIIVESDAAAAKAEQIARNRPDRSIEVVRRTW